jgi:preprotein translocase subunit YajC
MNWLIPQAHAAEAGGSGMGSFGGIPLDFFIIGGFILVFYFIIWRPQSKRAKEHRELIAALSKGG